MAVLYRKYRPQIFAEVVGQKPIIKTLQNQVAMGQVAHAYLFVGSRGVGKTSVARILAKAVNCLNRQPSLPSPLIERAGHHSQEGEKNMVQASPDALGDACGECESCKAVAGGHYIDLIEIDAASNTGVDNVRELIEHVKFSPSLGRFKVFIIDEVHMLSKGAFNALLKTLEEPPQHAIFVLATTEVGKVPATIISRSQRFDFKRLSVRDIETHLAEVAKKENLELPKEALRLVAEHSEGGLRDALSLLDKISTLGSNPSPDEVLQLIGITDIGLSEKLTELIASCRAGEIPPFIDSLIEKGVDFSVFNRDFLEYLRKILVIKIGAGSENVLLSESRLARAEKFAKEDLSENEIVFIIRLFLRSFKEQTSAPSADLPVLLAAVEAAMRKKINGVNSKVPSDRFEKSQPILKVETPVIRVENKQDTEQNNLSGMSQQLESVALAEALERWPEIIEKIMQVNGPLAHLLKAAPPVRAEGGRIIVGVKYKFHKQNLEHPKNQQLVAEILKTVFERNLALSGELISQEEPQKVAADTLSDALKVFGGELIE